MKKLAMVLALLFSAMPLQAVTLSAGNDQFGRACDIVSWNDSAAKNRSVWIVKGTPGAYISKMTYVAGGVAVTAQVPTTGFAFCTLVNHHTDNFGGAYTSSNGLSNPTSNYSGGSTYRAGVTASVPFAGTHHLIWRGTLQLYSHPWASPEAWFITVQYIFTDGRDDFIFSNAYDSGEMAENTLNSTNLSPYSDFDFDGDGSTAEGQTGIGVGTLYKFRTNDAAGSLNVASGWTYSAPNSIPYAWMYKDASKNDRELGVVQNQPYVEKDSGFNGYDATQFPLPPYNSTPGKRLPNLTDGTAYRLPYQMNVYADYSGQRFTWGTTYQAFRNNHTDGLNTNSSWDVYPVNGSSFNVLVDTFTGNGLPSLVTDTERLYASSLSATVGSVVVSGPKGPGNYLSPQTGTMPVKTYSHPGFDFLFRAWRFNAAANGNAVLNFTAGGDLNRPSFIIQKFGAAAPCKFLLDGVTQTQDFDFVTSYDAGSQELYVTFLKTLAQGARVIEIDSSCGSPTPSRTPCAACSPTSTSTITPSSTMTPTFTPTAACAPLLVDNLEDGNSSNLLGGVWSTWASSPATTTAFSVVAGYPLSPYGTVGSAHSSGNNSGTQVGSISTSFSPQLNLGAKDRLIFWINATAGSTSFHVNVARAAIVDFDNYGANFSVSPGVWTRVEITLASMAQAGWGTPVPMAWNDVTGLTFFNNSPGAYSISLDDIEFGCASPSPTASVSASNSPSPSQSPTFSSSPSPTPSFTAPPLGSSPTWTPTIVSGLPACSAPGFFGNFLQNNDKILFLGDSITYRGNFTKMVQAHLSNRFPAANFTFYNAGGPGDAGLQVWNRRAAVLAKNPNVVLLCLGMNDAYSLANYKTDFPNYMNMIVTYLQSNGIRVALLTPGICDLSLPFTPMAPDYNVRLRWEADWVLNYAASKSLPAFDINAEMAAADASMKAALPGSCMIPDSVHPDPAGGWIMGLGALRALGVPNRCGEISFSPGSVVASSPLAASGASANGFDLQLNTLPPVAPAAARKILPFEPLQAAVNHLGLKATGLPAASYYIEIDGHRSGPVSAASLASGINLYDYWTAPGSSANQWHHVDFLDTNGQPAYLCDGGISDGLIDDFETPPQGTWLVNTWAHDSWGLDPGSGSSTVSPLPAALAYSSPGNGGTGSCLRISGNADANYPPVLISYLNGLNSDVKQGIRFYAKGLAGKQVRFQIHSWAQKRMATESWNDYGYIFTFAATDVWQQVSIPYSSLALPSWGPTPYYPFVPQGIYNMDWLPVTAGAFDIAIDDIEFYCTGPAPTPTSSRTPNGTPTSTGTPSPSPTVTTTPSSTFSASPSATTTGTPSFSPTPSITNTFTPPPPGSSFTYTPSISPTSIDSPTVSTSPSPSPDASASPSPSASSTPSSTQPSTQTPTQNTSATVSVTGAGSPGYTSTPTSGGNGVPSLTATPTTTVSAMATPTSSPTPIVNVLPSVTLTPTVTEPISQTSPWLVSEGPLVISEVFAVPNPNPTLCMIHVEGPADAISVAVYSKSMVKLKEFMGQGNSAPGWVSIPINLGDLSNGIYYLVPSASRGARRSQKSVIAKSMILK